MDHQNINERSPSHKSLLKKSPKHEVSCKRDSAKSDKDVKFDHITAEDRRRSKSTSSHESVELNREEQKKSTSGLSPKVSRKYFTNWRQACDKTKDKTKDFLKRWKTLPEGIGQSEDRCCEEMQNPDVDDNVKRGWSVHVWTTWVNRFSEELGCTEDSEEEGPVAELSQIQKEKFTLFFTELLDNDRDDVIDDQDFDNFMEKLAHFADWSHETSEYHMLLEVKREFVENFLKPLPSKWSERAYYDRVCGPEAAGGVERCTLEGWLARWALQLMDTKKFSQLPLYLQYFCKILYAVVDRGGRGFIQKPALASFYRSVIGLPVARVDEIIDTAYARMTSNEYLTLDYGTYTHCYTNWLMGRNPNGPGQWVLVPPKGPLPQPPFPIDYSALNTERDKLEPYVPDNKSNRHSVIV